MDEGTPVGRDPVDQLLDEAACARLCVDFALHIDARRYQAVLDLFTDDGLLDRMGVVLRGRKALDRFLRARPLDVATRHLCTNMRVSFLAEDEATGVCDVLFFQGRVAEGTPVALASPSMVKYYDRFKRTPAGWRIQERRIRMAIQGANDAARTPLPPQTQG